MYTFIKMIGDKYIDIQNRIYIVKRGCQVIPDKIVWSYERKRYNYYKLRRGQLKMIPIKKVHPKFLFWDCRSNVNEEYVHPHN